MTGLFHPPTSASSGSLRPWRRWLPVYLLAVAAVAVAVAIRAVLTPALGTALPFITLFPAIFIIATVGGLRPTLLATVLGVLSALYLFIDPVGSLALNDPISRLGVLLFSTSGVAAGLLGESRLRAGRRARAAVDVAEQERVRAEQEALRAEEEAARAEEESARAEEETLHAEEETARAEAEARRASLESERVERILGSITDAFTVMDRDWVITYMNERAATMAGGRREDYIGRNHWEAFPATVGSPFEQAYRQAVAGKHVVRTVGYYEPRQMWI